MESLTIHDFEAPRLGNGTISSPLNLSRQSDDDVYNFVSLDSRVLIDADAHSVSEAIRRGETPLSFQKAGPREKIYFEPSKTKVGIVTCGGLCPGLNNVIRALVMTLYNRYKVQRIIGFKYGYEGFVPEFKHDIIELNPDIVDDIHTIGGTILGSSRGEQSSEVIVDTLERLNINILFTIGGDGTLRGAQDLVDEISRRNLKIAVAGIPKTIDNDISFIEKSFGFETAFSIANNILRDAHHEAKGAHNGIAIVKLMGRDSGFIAASAALSMPDVNFVIIPEMAFDLYGPNGFLRVLRKRLEAKHHALIVVAEGAGQFLFESENTGKDASGNKRYNDIGLYLKEKIEEEFKAKNFPFVMKYIDPSYIIRSAPAIANDSKFAIQLAQNAVHAAMAGRTGFVIGNWHNEFTILPIPLATRKRKTVNLEGELWYNVLESTGQPVRMTN